LTANAVEKHKPGAAKAFFGEGKEIGQCGGHLGLLGVWDAVK
jgi:hypothetical protein